MDHEELMNASALPPIGVGDGAAEEPLAVPERSRQRRWRPSAKVVMPLVTVAGVVYLSVIGYLLFAGVELIERLTIPWHISQRQEGAP
jgi:hypothetical protein